MDLDRICIRLLQTIRNKIALLRCLRIDCERKDLMEFVIGKNKRLPEDVIKGLPQSLIINSGFPAGKKIAFETDKDNLRIQIVYKRRYHLKHMPITGTSGIDIYVKNDIGFLWKKCIAPENEIQMYVDDNVNLGVGKKEVYVYLPPFASIDRLYVNIPEIKLIKEDKSRIVVYGSSITHGCAATRPGLMYTNILQRETGYSVLNFGFSESAKGEVSLINYIAKLNAKIIVLEYDHNASLSELEKTHWNVYETIRKTTDCWIIFMSRFSGGLSVSLNEEEERYKIINRTYQLALKKGDEKVSFISGKSFSYVDKSDYFVDGKHPNDLGMNFIAKQINRKIKERGMVN